MTIDDKSKLLLTIHEQCEIVQGIIGKYYDSPHQIGSCVELTKEMSYLLSLLMTYIIKGYSL